MTSGLRIDGSSNLRGERDTIAWFKNAEVFPALISEEELLGRHCSRLRRTFHRFRGVFDTSRGPLEITWADGGHLLLDVSADWTLQLSEHAWSETFAAMPAEERELMESEVGVWICADVSSEEPYASLVGRRLDSVKSLYNEEWASPSG